MKTEELEIGYRKIIREEGLLPYMIDYIRMGEIQFHKFIKKNEFKQGAVIASGGGGKIFECEWNGQDVVVKHCADQGILFNTKEEIRTEVALMSIFQHKNVLLCIGANLGINFPYFLMPRAQYSLEYLLLGSDDLAGTIQKVELPFPVRYQFAFQIAQGMKYIHSWKIIHRDLKSSNILVNDDLHCTITDFGISRLTDKSRMTLNLGTISWMAPELFGGDGHYTEAVDVYSFGMLLWEIVARDRPHLSFESWSIPEQVMGGLRPPIPSFCPFEFSDIINQCWSKNPAHRPTFSQLVVQLKEICDRNVVPTDYSLATAMQNFKAACAKRNFQTQEQRRVGRVGGINIGLQRSSSNLEDMFSLNSPH